MVESLGLGSEMDWISLKRRIETQAVESPAGLDDAGCLAFDQRRPLAGQPASHEQGANSRDRCDRQLYHILQR